MQTNARNRRNGNESDDELTTVYERPTSEQAKDRLNNADSATLNGWDVTLDDEDELKNGGQSESETSDEFELDEDGLEQAREDVEYVNALLNGDDPEADDDSQEESECVDCGENSGHEVFDDRCHECFIDAADRILATNPDDLVTDGGVAVEDDQTDLWNYGEAAVERADTCPHGHEWCDGPDSDELGCWDCFGGEQ